MNTDFYEYVPPGEWKTLNALEGFGQNRIEPTGALDGRSFELALEDGTPLAVELGTDGRAAWAAGGSRQEGEFVAREVAPELYFLDLRSPRSPERALVLVLDLERRIATLVTSTVVLDERGERRVEEEIVHAALPGAAPGDRHERTSEMVGHRVQYIYSPEHAYEHIYLNDSTYCWQCLAGEEQGQADCDPTRAYKLRERVYLLTWIERVVPCDGVVVIDWVRMRNNGRIFGWDTAAGEHNVIPMGARAVELNVTEYAPLAG